MTAADDTLPPLRGAGGGVVCPACRVPLPDEGPTSGPLRRCPAHGLAFIPAKALAEAADDPLMGATVAGRFVVLARLGVGAMGAVYRARQEATGRDVALKVVRPDRFGDPEVRVRFEREARATSALCSPHTITAFDFGESDDGAWFLAMELLQGETVGQRLRRAGPLPVTQAVRVTRHALRSLAEAHGKGIIHRDLKPDNLFLADDESAPGRVVGKVLDFGIAKVSGVEVGVDQLETQAGMVFGTPRYMSPEQAQGATLDARSDLYSLGVVLYQMLVGRPPFVDDDAVVVMAEHIKRSPPRFDEIQPGHGIPPALESFVRRLLAKSPAERPASAEVALAELEAVPLTASQSGLHAGWTAARARRTERSWRWWAGGAAGAGLLVALLLAARFTTRAPSPVGAAPPAPEASGGDPTSRPDGARTGSEAPSAPVATGGVVAEGATAAVAASASTPTRRARVRAAPPTSAEPRVRLRPGDRYGRFE